MNLLNNNMHFLLILNLNFIVQCSAVQCNDLRLIVRKTTGIEKKRERKTGEKKKN